MEAQLLKPTEKIERIQVQNSLLQLTVETIKAGIKLDETEIQSALAREALKKEKKKGSGKRGHRRFVLKKDEDENGHLERTYRAHEDRRFGLMVIGDRHRFTGKESDRLIFPEAAPLDFSFCLLNNIEEIITEQEPPQERRNYKQPVKTGDDRYITSSLRLSYNVLYNFEGFINTLYKILDAGPMGLCWLDLSFNSIAEMDDDTLTQLPNLRILYLHGNQVADMLEVQKLRSLSSLHTLTLHGNPIEQDPAYRISVLYYLPSLKSLDYFAVTKSDRATSNRFGSMYQNHWEKKHVELVAAAKVYKQEMNISLTSKLMTTKSVKYLEDGSSMKALRAK